jgi:hypothetical protein
MDPKSNMLLSGTVLDIPFPGNICSSGNNHDRAYTILFDNGSSASIPLSQMSGLIPSPPVSSTTPDLDALLPPFLQLNSRITYEHDEQYHKGWLSQRDGVYRFSFKSHVNKQKEEWGVPLPYGPQTRLLERHGDKGSDYIRPMYANTPPQFDVARCKIGL